MSVQRRRDRLVRLTDRKVKASYIEGVEQDQDWDLKHADLNGNTDSNLQAAMTESSRCRK